MKFKKHVLFLLLFYIGIIHAQKQLTTQEKIADFNYLYNVLKESYPYFGINKRVYKTDWLANKNTYLKALKNTKDDIAFFKEFQGIINDLHNDHTDAYPTIAYPYFYKAYKYAVTQDTVYKNSLLELEKTDSLRAKYWAKINHDVFFSKPEKKQEDNRSNQEPSRNKSNVTFYFNDTITTAAVSIKTFSYEYVEKDADTLKQFFTKAHNYKNLIIDIQGNDGGSTDYWWQNIIAYLIDKPIDYPMVYAFKNSKRLQKFKPSYFKDLISHQDIKLANLPIELQSEDYLFRNETLTIKPNSDFNKKFKGKIYLLVDNVVFSSSEALAYFCKATKFATVAGIKTNGDGVGSDPLLVTLPYSGIVVRFTGEMGLNPDGSANDETKTVPDLPLKGKTKSERFKMLIDFIKS